MPRIESAAQRNSQTVPDYIVEVLNQTVPEPYDEELERQILEGLNSGPAIEVTPAYWKELRARLEAKYGKRPESQCVN